MGGKQEVVRREGDKKRHKHVNERRKPSEQTEWVRLMSILPEVV